MEFKDFADRIGQRYTITQGELTQSDSGEFVVSETFATNTIYLNKLTNTYSLITKAGSYIGRNYKIRKSDCVAIVTEWVDENFNTNYASIYAKTTRKDLLKYLDQGMCLWFEDNNFIKINLENLQMHDSLVYNYDNGSPSHIGVYVGNNKILHHIPDKLSCMDILDTTKILGIYRHAN